MMENNMVEVDDGRSLPHVVVFGDSIASSSDTKPDSDILAALPPVSTRTNILPPVALTDPTDSQNPSRSLHPRV
jgi:hypothetical protein